LISLAFSILFIVLLTSVLNPVPPRKGKHVGRKIIRQTVLVLTFGAIGLTYGTGIRKGTKLKDTTLPCKAWQGVFKNEQTACELYEIIPFDTFREEDSICSRKTSG
jgi:hypothetical protein